MHLPGAPSLVFLGYLLVFLPWAAFRSAQRFRAARAGGAARPLPARQSIWTGALIMQGVLLILAWRTGATFDYDIFSLPPLTARDGLACAAALLACFILRFIARRLHSDEERLKLLVFALAPRNAKETLLRGATVLMASVAEEAAYRGVGLSILWYALGSFWIAAVVSALAFALAHWMQGWKNGAVIFGIGLVLQGLVQATGTLVLAMIAHAIYDFVAGYLIAREARRRDQDAAGAAPEPA